MEQPVIRIKDSIAGEAQGDLAVSQTRGRIAEDHQAVEPRSRSFPVSKREFRFERTLSLLTA